MRRRTRIVWKLARITKSKKLAHLFIKMMDEDSRNYWRKVK